MYVESIAGRAFQRRKEISWQEMFGGIERRPIFATRLRKTDSSSKVCE